MRRHVFLLVIAKLAFLAALYFVFFSSDHRPVVTPERVDRLLFPHK